MLLSEIIEKFCDKNKKLTSALEISGQLVETINFGKNTDQTKGVEIYKLKDPNLPESVKSAGCVRLKLYVKMDGFMYLGVSYQHGREELYPVIHNSIELQQYFIDNKAYCDQLFSDTNPVVDLDWEAESQRQVYETKSDGAAQGHYDQLHAAIIKEIKKLCSQLPNNTQLNIVDGGCGEGKLLKKLAQEIDGNTRDFFQNSIRLLGFDFNAENVKEANSSYDLYKNTRAVMKCTCIFTQGDLLDAKSVIDLNVAEGALYATNDKETISIFVSAGGITRRVLLSLYDGIDSLQSIANSNMDYLIGGGIGVPMINRYLAHQFGFKIRQVNETNNGPRFFFYERMSFDEILRKKIDKINNKNLVDLSFCPSPVEILRKLKDEIKYGDVIDLSFCCYTPELVDVIDEIIKEKKGIKLLMHHHKKEVYESFISRYSGKDLVIDVNLAGQGKASDSVGLFSRVKSSFRDETPLMPLVRRKLLLSSRDAEFQVSRDLNCLFAREGQNDFAVRFISEEKKSMFIAEIREAINVIADRSVTVNKREGNKLFSMIISAVRGERDNNGFSKKIEKYVGEIAEKLIDYLFGSDTYFNNAKAARLLVLIWFLRSRIICELTSPQDFENQSCSVIGPYLNIELDLYKKLAIKFPDKFPPEVMHQLSLSRYQMAENKDFVAEPTKEDFGMKDFRP